MRQTILNEQPFQVLTTAFSIGPSQTGYDLQISADGVNFSTLFSVPADTTRMITNVARGSTYRCLGNEGEIVVNWVRDCSAGEGGGGGTGPQGPMGPAGPQGPQGPAGSGETGDNHILKAVSETPEDAEVGDVYALSFSGAPVEYGDRWDDTGNRTISFADHEQAYRIAAKEDGYLDFGFDDADWHDGMHQYITSGCTELSTTDGSDRVQVVSPTELKFIHWGNKHGGKTIHVKLDDGYVYVWSDDVNELWLTDVAQNSLGADIETGEVIPAKSPFVAAYQMEEVRGEGDFSVSVGGDFGSVPTIEYGDDDNISQIVLDNYGETVYIAVNDTAVGGEFDVCAIDDYGNYYKIQYDAIADEWNIWNSDETQILYTAEYNGGKVSCSINSFSFDITYEDNDGKKTLKIYWTCWDSKGLKNWDNVLGDFITVPVEIAYKRDIPTMNTLLPNGEQDRDLIAWNGYSNDWGVQHAESIVMDKFRDYGSYNNGQEAMVRSDYWTMNWAPVVESTDVLRIVKITQSDYDTLVLHDEVSATTLYLIVDNNQGA